MARLNGPKRRKLYRLISQRDGEFCWIGGEPGDNNSLVVDHWDNDNSNNDPQNCHLLCRSMNGLKNPRGRDRRHKKHSSVCVGGREGSLGHGEIGVATLEMLKNQTAEPAFRHWLFGRVVREGRVSIVI